jgi:hypothetical protein
VCVAAEKVWLDHVHAEPGRYPVKGCPKSRGVEVCPEAGPPIQHLFASSRREQRVIKTEADGVVHYSGTTDCSTLQDSQPTVGADNRTSGLVCLSQHLQLVAEHCRHG